MAADDVFVMRFDVFSRRKARRVINTLLCTAQS
jgi:hypothetical protein